MASIEIREHVMAFEPDKCKHCGALVASLVPTKTHYQKPFPDVIVTYDCGSEDWFSTWVNRYLGDMTEGVTGMHVGEVLNDDRFKEGQSIMLPVYMRRVLTQKGDCFKRTNALLVERLETAEARISVLEAEDRLSKERLRMLLDSAGLRPTHGFGPTEYPI